MRRQTRRQPDQPQSTLGRDILTLSDDVVYIVLNHLSGGDLVRVAQSCVACRDHVRLYRRDFLRGFEKPHATIPKPVGNPPLFQLCHPMFTGAHWGEQSRLLEALGDHIHTLYRRWKYVEQLGKTQEDPGRFSICIHGLKVCTETVDQVRRMRIPCRLLELKHVKRLEETTWRNVEDLGVHTDGGWDLDIMDDHDDVPDSEFESESDWSGDESDSE